MGDLRVTKRLAECGSKWRGVPAARYLSCIRHRRTFLRHVYTVIETDIFVRYAETIWEDGEREALSPGWRPIRWRVTSGGLRKVRWSRPGTGKRGGVRVIYYNALPQGQIWLLIAYAKARFDNLPVAFLKQLKEAISDG